MQWYVAFVATILAHIRVKPGTANRFEDVARKLYAETHANESRVRRYEYWRGSEENTYYTLLSFDSFVGFMEHQTSDHHESASPSLGPIMAGLRLEWVDPIGDSTPLEPTNHEDLPTDANDLMLLYGQRFAPDVAGWWMPLRRTESSPE